MDRKIKINFDGLSFCFTGKLVDLKRTQAERETRSRGGLTTDVINNNLDYLVIGSIPSTGWKFGDYGRKIEKAIELQKLNNNKPKFIQEIDFMESLALTNVTNSGEIDAKVIVCKYKFITKENEYDISAFDDWMELLQQTKNCHVSVFVEDSYYLKLFLENVDKYGDDNILISCRIVKQLDLNDNSQEFIDDIARGFESIKGIDGNIKWFEKKEGTAGYIRLLNEIPQYRRNREI